MVLIEAQALGLPSLISDKILEEPYTIELIDIIRLEDSVDEWATRVNLYNMGLGQNDMYEETNNSTYNVSNGAKELVDFHLKIMRC